jgi:diguanylate cyclase (GGDEF)-like protein
MEMQVISDAGRVRDPQRPPRRRAPLAPRALWRRLARATATAPPGPEIFSRGTRRLGHAWLLVSVPAVAVAALFVQGERPYLIAWAIVCGLYTTPAIFNSVVVCRRVVASERRFWQLWAWALVSLYSVGVAVLISALTGITGLRYVAMALVGVAVIIFSVAVIELLNARSGHRALTLDLVESTMLALAIVAFAPLLFAGRPVAADTTWFTVPAAVSAVALAFGFCWSLALYRSLKGEPRIVEGFGVALACTGGAVSVAHVAQGMSGFTLPAAPMLTAQALCMALLLMLPGHLRKEANIGLTRLAPQAQVRTSGLDSFAIALLVPLLAITVNVRDRLDWAVWYFLGVALALLLMATVRDKLSLRETRRLYRRVEDAADERRRLLADVMQSVDHDRHRVAAQLHQQATAFYLTFTTYLRSTTRETDVVHPALQGVRDELAQQAESMRQLMLAVRPLESNDRGASDLTSAIEAYIDSLYGDGFAPVVSIDIDEDLELEWTTETIAFRILQEALRNAHEHAAARHLQVTIGFDAPSDSIRLEVVDDGVGFDVERLLYESGIATMRNFAAHAGGTLTVESTPGRGAIVTARLRALVVAGGTAEAVTPPTGRARLRVIDGGMARRAGEVDADEAAPASGEHVAAERSHLVADVSSAVSRLLEADPREAIAGVRARLDERRATTTGRHYLRFKFRPERQVISVIMRVVGGAFVAVPVVEVAALHLGARPDSLRWVLTAVALYSVVVLTNLRDLYHLRKRRWEKFDPRMVVVQLTLGSLATGALGVAVGGQLALFAPLMVIVLVIGAILSSRIMIVGLWVLQAAIVATVVVSTQGSTATTLWTIGIYALTSALLASMIDVSVGAARDGLSTLENVADFASFTSGVRQWYDEEEGIIERVASLVDVDGLVLYERPHRGRRGHGGVGEEHGEVELRELARWCRPGSATLPVAELRSVASRATVAGGFDEASVDGSRKVRMAIAASTTNSEVILAVQLRPGGARDDAALVTAVSMIASVLERSALIDDLVDEARSDPLTGLANRRHLHEFLAHEVSRATRTGEPLSFAILDLDHFKVFNDTWGHAAGDRALKQFAERISARVRAQDVVARFGGEEFCVLLPNTPIEDAARVLDELQRHPDEPAGHPITFSAGVAQWVAGEGVDALVARADAALYRAKDAGRDRVHLADPMRVVP